MIQVKPVELRGPPTPLRDLCRMFGWCVLRIPFAFDHGALRAGDRSPVPFSLASRRHPGGGHVAFPNSPGPQKVAAGQIR